MELQKCSPQLGLQKCSPQLELQRCSSTLGLQRCSSQLGLSNGEVSRLGLRVEQFQEQCWGLLEEQGEELRGRLKWRMEHLVIKWEILQGGLEGGYSKRDIQSGMCRFIYR